MIMRISIGIVLAALMALLGACSEPLPGETSPPPSVSPQATAPVTTTPAQSPSPTQGITFGMLATEGENVFASSCARCHGNQGQGVTAPPVIGGSANLSKFGNAQTLLDYIDMSMPFDAPGSLTKDQYNRLLSLLLVKNNSVTGDKGFTESDLKNIKLTR